ncbi:Multiple C2 and transmembrane domain-containing protein 1, partial [Operophtera brumata]
CVLDLSQLEEERTHDVWHTLDDGFGHVHLSVTMCNTQRSRNVPQETNENHALGNDFLGRVTIPLLKINNGQMRWYALKDMARRHSAKGNCPRVLLEMSLYWN